MKPKLALKLVPISGLVFGLHTATLLALWGGKASHAQPISGGEKNILKMKHRSDENGVNKRNYRNAAKNWNIEDNNGKQTVHNTVKKKIQTKLHDSRQMDRMKT